MARILIWRHLSNLSFSFFLLALVSLLVKWELIPIVIYYGDFIAEKPDTAVGPDKWRSEYEMAKQFVMTVNRHGGDATLVHLPDIGIKGNSHFLMAEKNNQEIAGILASWLQDKGLDK